ncbi:uncharacterized protein [Gorilla gorilla gorilla]|uniref:uncharacterized protein isoform X2 n=1 Tax=Gorilla gorilla gorilla TaxID=9595 RepID=UPI0024457608|nr:uncharacterized protein LOC129531757 isoform X2 [Gorilla gorilla gorilla]XP_055234653.1 uncharacterized protein LOC129531757 isoform X2 [Gorilla gorilla gorilla]
MFFFIKERNQLFRTGPHLSSGVISVLHRSAELGALYRTLSSLKYPSWRVRTPHDDFSGVKFRRHGADNHEASAATAAATAVAAAAAARVNLT